MSRRHRSPGRGARSYSSCRSSRADLCRQEGTCYNDMITMNHHLVRAGVIAILLAAVGGAQAFLDEVIVLKQELRAWETTHAMDFGDIVEQLDDLSGPVFGDVADGDW